MSKVYAHDDVCVDSSSYTIRARIIHAIRAAPHNPGFQTVIQLYTVLRIMGAAPRD